MLYIVTGLPYSGKTTLINNLKKRFGFAGTSVDQFIEEEKLDVKNMDQKDWDRVYTRAYGRLKKLLLSGKSVLFDGGSLKRSERETLKKIAGKAGCEWKMIWVNTSRETIRERWSNSRTTKERGQLEEEVLEKAMDMFEEPTPDENYIAFNSAMNFEEWVGSNIV